MNSVKTGSSDKSEVRGAPLFSAESKAALIVSSTRISRILVRIWNAEPTQMPVTKLTAMKTRIELSVRGPSRRRKGDEESRTCLFEEGEKAREERGRA